MNSEIVRCIELLKAERECVTRNSRHTCNRDCANCDLVQDDYELLWMYDTVIAILEGYHGEASYRC